MADVVLVDSPIRLIERASKSKDWLSAFAAAVSHFEYYGAKIIRKRCEKLEIPELRESVERMTVANTTLVLRLLEAIDVETYQKMRVTMRERNNLVHPARRGIAYAATKEERRALEILDDAKDCLRSLEAQLV